MFNRLRRWLIRRIEGVPTTPLSVLGKPPANSGPWTISRIENELRGGFGSPYREPGHAPWWNEPDTGCFDTSAWSESIDLDAWRDVSR